MHLNSTLSRNWKASLKVILTICLLFVSTNNLCAEIGIRAVSFWILGSSNRNSEPLRPGKYEEFKAMAFRTNPHDFQLAPGIEKDPKIGYIEFSATGEAKKHFLSKLRDNCQICKTQLTHSVKFKWDKPGAHTVTAKVVDENGVERDSVTWNVQVGESTFEDLPDLPSVPNIPDPPTVKIWPETSERSGYVLRVGEDMKFEVKATSDDGIDAIAFYSKVEDSFGSGQLIGEKKRFLFDKKALAFWPTFKVEYAWQTPGEYTMIAKITSKAHGQREIKWNITVKPTNQPPTLVNKEGLTDLGSLVVGGAPGRIEVSEHFRDPEGRGVYFDEVNVNPATPNIVTLRLLGQSEIEIEPKNPGRAVFYAVARESDGLIETQSFIVTVTADSNRAPAAVNTILAQSLTDGDSSAPLDISRYFRDPDGDSLTYTVVSSDPNVAIVQLVGSQLTVRTLRAGNITVTVTATDPAGLSATQTFNVTVTEPPVQQKPEAVGTIPEQVLTVDGASKTVDIAQYFSAKNDLTYDVSSSRRGIVTAQISRARVTITPKGAGSASLVVTARDRNNSDLYAIQTIVVIVRSKGTTIVRPPPSEDPTFTPPATINPGVEGLREGTAIIVQNLSQGFLLRVRAGAGTHYDIEEELGNGVKGIIIDGPRRNNGYKWWKIDWDIRGVEGWSIEADRNGEQLLFRRPPDLEIRDLGVSDNEVVLGETFEIEIRVRNNGPGESVATQVYVYYSPNRHANLEALDGDDDLRVPGRRSLKVPSLREGGSRTLSFNVEAPGTPDTYYYGAFLPSNVHDTDYTRDLDPDALRNNFAREERVAVTGSPDLIVESISANESTVDPGESFRLDATVRNEGIGEPKRNATLRYYRSADANISDSDTDVGDDIVSRSRLDTNETEDEFITLRAPRTPGIYYYGACVTLQDEKNKSNNCSGAVAITVRETAPAQTPDLVPRVPTVSANALAPGESFILATAVENRGTGTSGNTTLRWYRSVDPNIASTDTIVGSSRVRSLAPGQPQIYQLTLTAPVAAGTYYYGVGVEGVSDESDTTNNYSTSVAVTVEKRAPRTVGTIPPQTLSENDPPTTVDVAAYFSSPNDTPLTYTAVSDNTAVVLTQMNGSELTLTPVGAGDTTVEVAVSDGDLTATQTLVVSVIAAPTENQAPVTVGVIPVQSLTLDEGSSTVDISAYFSDANGDTLTYAAWPNDKNVVRLQRKGTLLTIIPKAAGRATVTVRARDPEGLEVFQRFSVFVSDSDVPVPDVPAKAWMPDANLRAAVRTAIGLASNDPLTQQTILALTSLRYLGPDLSDNEKITDLTGLEYALNLEHLDLYAHLIGDLRPLAELGKLRSLWLAGNKIANIRPLTSLPLEQLDLGGNPIADFAPLSELASLTRLDFWGNRLGDNDLSSITGLTQLTELDLRVNQISDVTPLTKLVNLKKLRLEGNPISDTALLLDLTSQNPNLEIDIEISEEPPSQPDTEIAAEVPDLFVESVRVNNTAVAPGDIFRLDAVIRNQGKATSGAGKVHFYRSSDETITAEDTKVRTSDMPSLAADRTKNRWARLSAPDTPGIYYYGVCIEGVADESNTENNCSTAVKITVGTVPAKPTVVEKPTTAPETGEDPPATANAHWMPDANLRAAVRKALGLKPSEPLTQQAVRGLTWLIATQPRDAAVQNKIKDITGLEHATQLTKLWLSANQISDLTPLKNLTALTELRLWYNQISDLTPLKNLTALTVLTLWGNQISDLTPLKNLTALTELVLSENQISDLTPLKNLTALTDLGFAFNQISDLTPLKNLTALTRLYIGSNQIRDLTPLTGLKNLEYLALFNMEIDDNYFASLIPILAGLTRLRYLDLGFNEIRDATPLTALVNLKSLVLWGNPVTEASLRQLKLQNPGLEIKVDVPAAPSAPALPDETALLPNYPNPFNPETWIPYQLSEAADVTLIIYDVKGVMVRRLALGHRPAGFYYSRGRAAHWDGRNALGEKVASGLYFYTFTAGDFTATQKLLIRK